MIERLANDVLQDEYFIKLNNKAAKLLANNLFSENGRSIKLTEKELNDTLRFADILSNSKIRKRETKLINSSPCSMKTTKPMLIIRLSLIQF